MVVLELASLTSGEDIVPALGALLGIAEVRGARSLRDAVVADLRGRVFRALGDEPTVLVLDNCEHLVEDVACVVADLLAVLPSLRVLTTSRAPLAIAGEVVAPLAPLPVDADGAAVRLFTERARAARPGAVLPVDAVRRICTRLDGSPLAIELAAARIRGMSTDEIERRLDDRFALLRGGDRSAPERHRTLLAVIEWSWRLLDAGRRGPAAAPGALPGRARGRRGRGRRGSRPPAGRARRPGRAGRAVPRAARRARGGAGALPAARDRPGVRCRTARATAAPPGRSGTRWCAGVGRSPASRNLFTVDGRCPAPVVPRGRPRGRQPGHAAALEPAATVTAPAVAQVFSALGGYWTLRGAHGEVVAIAPEVRRVLRRTADPAAGGPRRHGARDSCWSAGHRGVQRPAAPPRCAISRPPPGRPAGLDRRCRCSTPRPHCCSPSAAPSAGSTCSARYRDAPDPAVSPVWRTRSAHPWPRTTASPPTALALRRTAPSRWPDRSTTPGRSARGRSPGPSCSRRRAVTPRRWPSRTWPGPARGVRGRGRPVRDRLDRRTVRRSDRGRRPGPGDRRRPRAPAGGEPGRLDGDAAQIGVLAIAIGAECARSDGRPRRRRDGVRQAWDVVLPRAAGARRRTGS